MIKSQLLCHLSYAPEKGYAANHPYQRDASGPYIVPYKLGRGLRELI